MIQNLSGAGLFFESIVIHNKDKLKKKLIFVLIAAFIVSAFSLLYYQEGGGCPLNPGPNMGICIPIPKTRGWPLLVPIEDRFNRINETLWVEQFIAFFINFLVYFIVFSSIYFAYSKLIKKSKNK